MSSVPMLVAAPPPRSPWIAVHVPLPPFQVAVLQSFHSMPPLSGGATILSCGQSTPSNPPAGGATMSTAYLSPAKPVASLARLQPSPALADVATPLSMPAYSVYPAGPPDGTTARLQTEASSRPPAILSRTSQARPSSVERITVP